MVEVLLDPGVDALLRQEAASIEMTPSELASLLLTSTLIGSLTR